MAKEKTLYACSECGAQHHKWAGQCSDCNAWNTLNEIAVSAPTPANTRFSGYAGEVTPKVQKLSDVEFSEQPRESTGIAELDRVLGGGLVAGSVILIGGDPGIGKSTLLLQTLVNLSQNQSALYVSGEESLEQISLRASRLQTPADKLAVLMETCVERLLVQARNESPRIMVVDSIQTIFSEQLQSAPGSVAQVREASANLVRYAKQNSTIVFLVGHVTKEGALAGPRVLEHMVDTVLYFEGQRSDRYRVLRAVKNRFGAVNELGIFAMTDTGLKEVSNPSAIFLSRHDEPVSGSSVMVTWEGTRPMLVEIQALVDQSPLGNPRRVTLGLEQNRLAMLLAVLHRHAGIGMFDQDVYVNAVGGVRVTETASDLAVLFAALSSFRDRPLDHGVVVFGEIGLAGEIRPVPNGEDRLREAAKHGFHRAIVPMANVPKRKPKGMEVLGVQRISQAIEAM